MSAGDERPRPADGPASPAEGYPVPGSPGDPARNPALVSFWLLEPVADAAMTYFYAQLFTMDTEIRAMFPAAMDVQRRRFFAALSQIAAAQGSQEDRDQLAPYLRELGRAHRKFGVRERHYEVVRRALIATLQRFAAPGWNETAKHAWETAFSHAAGIMIDAAKDDAAESPVVDRHRDRPTRSPTPRARTGCSACTYGPFPAAWSARCSCTRSRRATRSCSARRIRAGTARSCSTTVPAAIRTCTTCARCGKWKRPTRGSRSSRRCRTSPPMTTTSCTAPSPSWPPRRAGRTGTSTSAVPTT